MKLAIIGLGKMGMNMAKRLLRNKIEVVAFNRTSRKTEQIEQEGAIGAYSLEEVINKTGSPRIIWLMLPAGKAVDEYIERLADMMSDGDIIIDGGNSFYKDSVRRHDFLYSKGIRFIDAGISGGVWGLEAGYCTMVGGDIKTYKYLEPVFRALAPKHGYMYCGATGAGHYTKMVHNGIEYAMMQSYAEGFEILKSSPYRESLNFADLSRLWNQGSVIRSWLLELLERAFADDDDLSDIEGYVEDSGEGRWTVQEAIDLDVPAEVILMSLFKRFRSRQSAPYSDKVIAALRNQFGGHSVKKRS
ncbi:MAG: decarboxylating 6-phosphogluconate dehydrogenase [Nitrospirota bacterium]|nr:MAG: decarboxylating 6-phosphogluconate dehydrogenase [Nitrospirota bacterium]